MIDLIEKYKLPSRYADYIGLSYSKSTSENHKKNKGQYLTPKTISDFMGNLAKPKTTKISILDPGCGTAILSCSLIEKLVLGNIIKEVDLTLYEIDKAILVETMKVVVFLKKWLKERNVKLTFSLNETDFILDNYSVFHTNTLFEIQEIKKFDYIISNPPYFKISKSDKRAIIANELVYGQPNIYSIFMGLAAKLLKPSGELIFIIPRSFAAGNYFKAFRESFFHEISISDIHIFQSRNKMFKNDNVLQENIILRASKKTCSNIKITVSESDEDINSSLEYSYNTEDLIDLKSHDKILFIPSNSDEFKTIETFREWNNTLNDFNIKISTGPVVAFRNKDFLQSEGQINETISPLIWLHNIKEMEFSYPLQKEKKPSLIENSEASRKVLLRNKNYIFLRRFSSKDDKSRLVCCPYFSSNFDTEMIGVENHINYIHRPDGNLSEDEIWGISALFSSSLFDTYFRTFNGNTQVGATELKQITVPPLKEIKNIGRRVKELNNPSKEAVDNIINTVLFEKKTYVKNTRSTSNLKRVGVA